MNKHRSLKLQGHGLELRLEGAAALSPEKETAAVGCATKPFDAAFSYFEVKILTKLAAPEADANGYVSRFQLPKFQLPCLLSPVR